MPEPLALDDIDRDILAQLGAHGRLTWQQLGPRVGLSPNATAERVRRLERAGVITGYRAVVDPEALGRGLESFVLVKMHPTAPREPFERLAIEHDAIVDMVHLTGAHDYLVHTRCRGTAELDALLMDVKAEAGVAETETRIVLRRIGGEAGS